MAQVTLSGVEKVYRGGVRAVRDLNLRIEDGRFVALVGPSGCGKSTTLRMIAGLEPVTAGVVSIGGRPVNGLPPRDRDVAMVFQNYALYPHMTARQNLAFGLKLRKTPREEIERRVRAAAALLGLDACLDRRPGALSGGQRQRVALGRAIVREPACFLFDEPLSNLDAPLRAAMRSELKALHRRLRTTTVYVTHDQEEAMTLGDMVVVMAEGAVQQAGTPAEVYRSPVNRFVAGFVGAPPMNFLDGVLQEAEDAVVWRERAGQGLSVVLPQPLAGPARRGLGAPRVLGVRPGAVTVGPVGPDAAPCEVASIEPLGEQTDLRLVLPSGAALTARVPAPIGSATPGVGDRVGVSLDPSRVHLFEPGPFGRSLAPADANTEIAA